MGLLNSNTLNDYITKTIPANARSMWQGVKRIPQDLAQLTDPAFMQGLLSQPRKPLDPNEMAAMGMDYVQPMGGLLAHTVYHGSPHKFDKFDMSKIGTGEGAQAYGHGLYFAEAPEVAKSYSKMNPTAQVSPNRLFNGQELTPGTPEYHAGTLLEHSTLAQARKDVARWIAEGSPDANAVEGWKKTLETLNKANKKSDFKVGKNENLYKVDIPDESIPRMLDWDKPLSEQSDSVRNALAKSKNKQVRAMLEYAQTPYSADIGGEQKTMGEAFRLLNLNLHGRSAADSAKASTLLAKQGIPGIRYLDGMSRGQGGTSNFVLFDDQLPRILEVNGQPTGLLSYADEAKKAKEGGLLSVPIDSLKLNEGGVGIAKSKWAWEPDYIHKNTNPISVDKSTNEVLDGYHRLEQARRNGEKNIKIKYVDLSDEQRKALGLIK